MSAAVEARDLYRFFHAGDEEVLALRGVSVAAEAGEVVAVTGPSGSGKSTLMACLAGLDEPDGGTVRVAGRRMSRVAQAERSRIRADHVGVLLQSANLVEHLTVGANLRLARSFGSGPAPTGLLERLGIAGRVDALPGRLSGGEAARAGLAVALANSPEVLLADEPTGELDGDTEADVVALLRGEAARGVAVLVVTHSATMAGAADRVVRLRDGQVVA